MEDKYIIVDGNEAAAKIAFKTSEVIAIYPITPSSPMGEWADAWSSEDEKNIFGTVPSVIEMQSEGGAAGTLHGALQTGALSTTFTASQGLLLMIPNMFKIAGELTPAVIHVAARSIAAQGLSIFGDHSDVMATRSTGFAMLVSDSVQMSMDMALISHASTLKSRIPFIHFFDGFRTSHEVMKIKDISDTVIREIIEEDLIFQHRNRALNPNSPVIRGTAQNPDVYFQARESVNPYYKKCPEYVQIYMDKLFALTGRRYNLFEYYGDSNATEIIIAMGSACETISETIDHLNSKGKKVGLLKIRLYRPFDTKAFLNSIPESVKSIAVLDRLKEPGSDGEPLYLDVIQAFYQQKFILSEIRFPKLPTIVGGRYGLSSKEFTPSMVISIFENLEKNLPKNNFTIGILDDVSMSSLEFDPNFQLINRDTIESVFYGLGSDGTVGANKNTIKIIGDYTDNFAQGYFVYDSKKSGSMTVSHLRFGKSEIRSTYLISNPDFVACHQPVFLKRIDMLSQIKKGGTFLLNTEKSPTEIWDHLPGVVQKQILDKELKFYTIDGYKVAREAGMKNQINIVMQVCFFAISGILPKNEAIEKIKYSIEKVYGKKGEEIVRMNLSAVDKTLANLILVDLTNWNKENLKDDSWISPVDEKAPDFVKNVLGKMISWKGDTLPVSALPNDGTYPTGTAQYEKRNIAKEIPVWDTKVCIQCGKCSFVCPHSVIRMKVYDESDLNQKPNDFKHTKSKVPEFEGKQFTLQISPEDCTGCGICVDICPAKNKSEVRLKAINMMPIEPILESEKKNWDYFNTLPMVDRNLLKISSIRQEQFQEPLFEFSGACAGCGETPYIKLATQLFGDRMLIANATGCSSIYGGNLPTTPYTKNKEGRGPAWSNSLFEDNAEFGLGYRVSLDKHVEFARELLNSLKSIISEELIDSILSTEQKNEADIFEQRIRVQDLKKKLEESLQDTKNHLLFDSIKRLLNIIDALVKKSVWIIGGDGWAYDIGFGGLDHVLSSGRNVNILVLDTEVYSNTGGQMSKSTPRGAVAKFAAGGKRSKKKDLGLMAMNYGNVYVASVAMGARDEHTLKAFIEAEAYEGPSLIIAYSHCIAHGINMTQGMQHQKAAVESGQWMLYRYNPSKKDLNENPFELDSKSLKIPVEKYMLNQNRFKMLSKTKPEDAKRLMKDAQEEANSRMNSYKQMEENGIKKEEVGEIKQ
jgi:pyruvate-ferredoxin/flavodoxin oxidoreductase